MKLLKFGLTPALVFFLLQGWSLPEAEDDSPRPTTTTPTPTTTTPTPTPRFETAETEAKSRHLRLTLTDPFFMLVIIVVLVVFFCCCCWRKDWKVKWIRRFLVRLLSFDSPSKINFWKNRNSLVFERDMRCLWGVDKACHAGSLGSMPAPSKSFYSFSGMRSWRKAIFMRTCHSKIIWCQRTQKKE